jgi:hypothetical protein
VAEIHTIPPGSFKSLGQQQKRENLYSHRLHDLMAGNAYMSVIPMMDAEKALSAARSVWTLC